MLIDNKERACRERSRQARASVFQSKTGSLIRTMLLAYSLRCLLYYLTGLYGRITMGRCLGAKETCNKSTNRPHMRCGRLRHRRSMKFQSICLSLDLSRNRLRFCEGLSAGTRRDKASKRMPTLPFRMPYSFSFHTSGALNHQEERVSACGIRIAEIGPNKLLPNRSAHFGSPQPPPHFRND